MSHFEERKEKSCLNCNAVVQGRFCHICGQENIEPKESVWHLISHFFQDITHFDGKFFSTLKYLLFKPGFLSREYMLGRRTSYLNPIRMYVFTSAFFFLYFFSTIPLNEMRTTSESLKTEQQLKKLKESIKGLREQQHTPDSTLKTVTAKVLDNFELRAATLEMEFAKSKEHDSLMLANWDKLNDSISIAQQKDGDKPKKRKRRKGLNIFNINRGDYLTVMAYDSVQLLLPAQKKDGWWRRLFTRKVIDITEKSNDKGDDFGAHVLETFLHSLPQMFFLSLPLYALFLSLLYRRGRKYYFVNHAIYSIHVFCATFIISFIFMLLGNYVAGKNDTLMNIFTVFFLLSLLIYHYKCMRNFYQQGRVKTILKFFILYNISLFIVFLLTIIFFIISLWKI